MREEKKIQDYKVIFDSPRASIYNNANECIAEFSLRENFRVTNIQKTFVVVENTENALLGVYDFSGNVVVPVEFNHIVFYDLGIVVKRDPYSGLYSYSGSVLIPVMHSVVAPCCYTNSNKVVVADEVKNNNNPQSNLVSGVYSINGDSSELIVPIEFHKVVITLSGLIKTQKEEDDIFEGYDLA